MSDGTHVVMDTDCRMSKRPTMKRPTCLPPLERPPVHHAGSALTQDFTEHQVFRGQQQRRRPRHVQGISSRCGLRDCLVDAVVGGQLVDVAADWPPVIRTQFWLGQERQALSAKGMAAAEGNCLVQPLIQPVVFVADGALERRRHPAQ